MKHKTCNSAFLAVVFLTLFLPLSAFAQDDKLGFDAENPTKEVVKLDPDTPSGAEITEPRISKTPVPTSSEVTAISRETELKALKPAAKPVEKTQKEEDKVQKKDEEDPLSFNFLYYIIEKFKFSDIVE